MVQVMLCTVQSPYCLSNASLGLGFVSLTKPVRTSIISQPQLSDNLFHSVNVLRCNFLCLFHIQNYKSQTRALKINTFWLQKTNIGFTQKLAGFRIPSARFHTI
ncbi:hypothetical protein AQUCO_00700259v1 [Aquilegia coerulea]|uniref:Uncharacterized protein n=1 Tax=Aquilegia coerulea TaxID=218851 RepID=A0A2G5EJ69_AQUCA|nr:hypothetical protein AQUCO_00700259v1 [Aquilegia coerulea]